MTLCSVVVDLADYDLDLCAMLDNEMSMREHINNISVIRFFYLRQLGKLRPLFESDFAQRLLSAFVLSLVDYCNAALADLPASILATLQSVLNAAARFLAGTAARTYISGIMKSLHWLPIACRIRFKICAQSRREQGSSPAYLSDTTTPNSSMPALRRLRSQTSSTSHVQWQNSKTECCLWMDHMIGTLYPAISRIPPTC